MSNAARAICSAKFPDLVARGLIKFADDTAEPPRGKVAAYNQGREIQRAAYEDKKLEGKRAYRAHLIVKMELKIAGIKATPDWWGNTRLSASVEAWEEALGMVRDQP